jgi:ClpP class serine protease
MPQVKPGESRNAYMARCVPEVMKEGKTNEQAVGKCEGMYHYHHTHKSKPASEAGGGCRYDTILGNWLIESDRLESYVDAAWGVVERGELASFQARSAEINEARAETPYTVAADGMARMTISGPMTKLPTSLTALLGGTSTFQFRQGLIRAMNDPAVKGVFLEVDSPGGTVDGTPELAYAIRRFNAVKPVFVHAADMMASAAMWAGSQGARVTAGPAALTGSVGSKAVLEDRTGEGGRNKPIVLTTGKHKAPTTPPFTPEKIAEVQRILNQMTAIFWGEVSSTRPQTRAHQADILTARVYVGQEAVKVGLVDKICSTEEAYQYAVQQTAKGVPASRGPGISANTPAAPTRSKAMPLTAQQLAELRALPGAAAATEDTADVSAFTAAMQLNRDLNSEKGLAQGRENRIRALETEVTTLKASGGGNGSSSKPIDPEILRGRCEVALDRLGIRLEKNTITSAQFSQIAGMLLTKGSVDKDRKLSADAIPNQAFFEKDAEGNFPYQKLFAALDENKPGGILKDVSGHQPAARTEPGTGDGSTGGKAGDGKVGADFGLAKHNEQRSTAGLKPLSRAEFDTIYPEYAGRN